MSLTPAHRNAEVTADAFQEGAINGMLTLLPSAGGVYLAAKNFPNFAKRTNMQARTALAIMPALFVFAFTAEEFVTKRMREIAKETEHHHETVSWAEDQMAKHQSKQQQMASIDDKEASLIKLYQQSVADSGVSIVPGDRLGFHHKVANYIATNPIKTLSALAVPSVAWIFYGNTGKEHLQFSVKLMHTRVFGQFATISLFLSVIGFREFMEQNGKFITQAEADARVEEMRLVRRDLVQRLEAEKQHQLDMKAQLAKAHEEDVHEKQMAKKNKKVKMSMGATHAVATSPRSE